MVALGTLAGFWVFGRELDARGLGHASHLAISSFVAGLVGAKLLWVAEHFGEESTLDLARGHHAAVRRARANVSRQRDQGYAPSEYLLKQWPEKALSGAGCPPHCGR